MIPNFNLSENLRQILAPFCNLTALILDENSVNDLRVSKIVNEINFEGV